jgi:PAS domain S-box-containing protein
MELAVSLFVIGLIILLWLLLWSRQRSTPADPIAVEALLRQVPLLAARDGVLIVDSRGRLIYSNDTVRRWLNLGDDALDLELIARHAQPADGFLALFARETQSAFQLADRWVEASSHRLPGVGSSPAGEEAVIVALLRDLSAVNSTSADLARALRVINEIGDTLNPSMSEAQVQQALLAIVRKALAFDAGEIAVWDAEARVLYPAAFEGDAAYVLALTEAGGLYLEGEGITGWIAKQRKPLLVADRDDPAAVRPKLPNSAYRSFIGIPLQIGRQFLGTFELARCDANAFTMADLALLTALQKPLAVALYNARLYAAQERRIEDVASLQALRVAEDDPDAVYFGLTERIANLLGVDMCGVLLYDDRRRALAAQTPFYGLPGQIARSYAISVVEGSAGARLWAEADHWLSNDLSDEPLAEPLGLSLLINAAGMFNIALLPLVVGARRIGLLHVSNKRARGGFTAQDVQMLRLLAGQAAVIVESLRLASLEERRDLEMSGLQEIAQAFGALRRASEFYASTNERIARLMGVQYCGILLYDEANRRLVAQPPFYGLPNEAIAGYQIVLEPGSALEQIWLEEDYWYTNNASTDRVVVGAGLDELASALGVDRTLLATLSAGGKRLGVVQVSNKLDGQPFNEKDARLLLIFAAQVAGLIENAQLFREAQRRAEEAESLRQIAELAGRVLTPEDDLRPLLRAAAQLLRCQGVFVSQLDAETGILVTHPRNVYGIQLNEPLVQTTYSRGFEYSVAISRRPFLSNDVRSDVRVLPGYALIAEQIGIEQTVMVPLVVGDVTLGEMGAINRAAVEPGGAFDDDDRALLAAIAAQVAAALDRVRIYTATGQNLSRRLQELDAINRVSNALASTLDIEGILEVIRLEAVRATDAQGSTIALLFLSDEQDNEPADEPIVERRLGDRRPAKGLAPIELAAVERAAVEPLRASILVEDYFNAEWPPMPETARSAVAVAFTHEERAIGVLHLYHSQAHHFTETDIIFLETLAAKASLGYGNHRRLIENQDYANTLRRRVEQLNQIFELGQMLQSNVDAYMMLEAIAYSIQQSCGYDVVLMLLADDKTGLLHRAAQAGMPIDVFEATRDRTFSRQALNALFAQPTYRISESLFFPFERLSDWYQEGIEAFVASFDSARTLHPRSRADWHDGDILIVPVLGAGGQLLGAISLDRPFDGKRPTRSTIEILEIFAHQAAATLENTRLYVNSLRSAEQEARLNEVMEAIASTLDPVQIVEGVARGVLQLLPFVRMTAAVLDSERGDFILVRALVGMDNSVRVERTRLESLDGTALGHAFSTASDRLYQLDDEPEEAFEDLIELRREGEATSLFIPLITGGLCVGALHLGSDLVNAYGFEEYRPLLRRIASLAAVALINATLYEEAQGRMQRLSLINRVSIALAQSLDTENVLEVALREIAEALNIEQARAYIFERESGLARVVVEYPRGDFPPEDVVEAERSPALRHVWRQADPVIIPAVGAMDSEFDLRDALLARGVSAYLLLPMAVGGQTSGAFELEMRDPARRFDREKLDLALIIANQAAIAVLNANLLEQTLVRTRELETLLEAAQATSVTLDLNDVFSSVVRLTMQALDMDDCALMMYDNVEEVLTVELDLNRLGDDSRVMARGTQFDLFQYPAKTRALRSGQIVIVRADDPNADPSERREMAAAGELARMLVPLVVRDQAIGLLQIEQTVPARAFTHREMRMAQALGAQAASAIENARLSTETAAQVEQSLIINELSRAISSTMDISDMIRIVRDQVPALTDAEEMYLALYDASSGNIVFPMAVRRGQDFTIMPRQLGSDEVSFVIRQRRPLVLGGDNPSADEVRRNLKLTNGEGDARRYLGVPLIAGDQVVGVLAVRDREQKRPFGLNDQRILTTIGTQLGAAIQNANLFERIRNFADELNQRVEERTAELQQERDRLDALYRITAELGRTLDLDRVVSRSLEMVAHAIKATEAVALLINPATGELYPRAIYSATGERIRVLESQVEANGGAGEPFYHPAAMLGNWLLTRQHSVLTEDLLQSEYWDSENPGAAEWRSALGVVLEANEEIQGVMVFLSERPGAFSEAQLRLVTTATGQVSAAINNADLYNLIRDQAENVSALLRAEQEQAEKQSAILEGIGDGVALADGSGRVVLFNQAAQQILGVRRDIALGQPLARILSQFAGIASWQRIINSWAAGERPAQVSDRLLSDRFTVGAKVINVRVSPVYIGSQFLGAVWLFRDITREVEVDRMKSEFIANVSHELRTPMTSIKGYADLLLMGAAGSVTERQTTFINTIKANADRLSDLIDDLLNISRIDAGSEPLQLEAVHISDVIAASVAKLRARADFARKRPTLTVMVDPALPLIRADRQKLEQVIDNLVENAFHYTYPDGSIEIAARLQPASEPGAERLLIAIKDDGIGIPESFRERVWNRFERYDAHALVMEVAGTGLGLPIVKHLVDLHQGEVWFESQENRGSTFYVALPVAGPAMAQNSDDGLAAS